MKSFLGKLSFFVLGLIIACISIICFTNNQLQSNCINYKTKNDVQRILLGHSHTEFAFNDSIVNDSYNLSQSGDSYLYSYLKLKKYIQCNPSIDVVFVEFSNNQIDEKMDGWIWDDIHLNYKFSKLCAFADWEDSYLLIKKNPRGYMGNLALGTRKNLEMIINPPQNIIEEKDWGGFVPVTDKVLSVDNNSYKIVNNKHKKVYGISITNLNYLKKIVSLLESHEKQLFLLRTPVHSTYHYLENEPIFDSIRKADFSLIHFLDFKDYPLLDSCFADDSHLNYNGSVKLSRDFQLLVDKGMLDSEDPQKTIDSLIEVRRLSLGAL